jgi:N-acyl-L-homoserine lactone synthetase
MEIGSMMPPRFTTYLADTSYSQDLHHNLRYKVYCERKNFEAVVPSEQLPQERDDYDSSATRFIVKDDVLGRWIGTARLVANEEAALPAQSLGAIHRHHEELLSRHLSAEVSRLAAVSAFRSIRITEHLLQSIIIAALGYSQSERIEWLVFLVSPGLARMLEKLDVPMEACGPEIEHRGRRRAFRSQVNNAINVIPWATPLRGGHCGYNFFSGVRVAA